MTDPAAKPGSMPSKAAARAALVARSAVRHAAEIRFRWFGIAMVATAVLACATLLAAILAQSLPALTEHRLTVPLKITAERVDPAGTRDPVTIRQEGDFQGLVDDALAVRFPTAEADGQILNLKAVSESLAALAMGRTIAENPGLIGTTMTSSIPINDALDLYFKGGFGQSHETGMATPLRVSPMPDGLVRLEAGPGAFGPAVTRIRERVEADAAAISRALGQKQARVAEARAALADAEAALAAAEASGVEARVATAEAVVEEARNALTGAEGDAAADEARLAANARSVAGTGPLMLTIDKPSILVEAGGGTWRLESIAPDVATARLIVRPREGPAPATWRLVEISTPESARPIKDAVIAFGRQLKADGLIKQTLNTTLFTRSDSNQPELSGLLSAIVGSLLTLLITVFTAIPIGVATAVYLEEFAPKNRWTDFIEVNINNLAAVPSIVFGLLGFAVFLTFFGMPRSAPVVGGIVLTLMSLPIIIIASRAALKAVPPSIREAALGVGASKMQTVFHHVLPLAMPGIMTGSILAMAHALGETAPLLMIGMVAFIADVPQGFTDSATVLPVEIYMWASRPERAWEPRTAAAILVLLVFMIAMNAAAIYLRHRFERKW